MNGGLGGGEGGFEVKKGNTTGAMFEESTGGGQSEDSGTTGDDGVAFDSEAGEGSICCREGRVEGRRRCCEGIRGIRQSHGGEVSKSQSIAL